MTLYINIYLTAGAISADIGMTVRTVVIDVFEGVETKRKRTTGPTAKEKHKKT